MELLGDAVARSSATRSTTPNSYMAIVAPENTRDGSDIPAERLGAAPGRRCASRHEPVPARREAVGRLLLPDRGGRAGRGHVAARRSRTSSTAPCWSTGRRSASGWSGSPSTSTRAEHGADRRRRAPTSRSASRAARARSTRSARTCRAARSSTRPSRTRPKGSISYSEYPACYLGHEVERRPLPLRGRPHRRRVGDDRRGVPARHARHRRGRAPARRVRDRLQPGHPAAHEEHALRREDGGHDPPRDRHRLPAARRARTRARVHWDMVKELRNGGRIELDGKVVQENGAWRCRPARRPSTRELLVERSLDVQPGWQVLIRSTPLGAAAARGARCA